VSDYPSGCLGKLPLHGDFIRYNAASAEVQELDGWIQDGIYRGYEQLDARWDGAFDDAPHARFIYRSPRSARLVAGLFKPSVDKAGRRYPFLVYTLLGEKALGNEIAYLPCAMDDFLARAAELSDWSDSAISLSAFQAGFESLRFSPDMAGARRNFARFVLARSSGEYFESCFGQASDPRRFAAVGVVAEGAASVTAKALRMPSTGSDAEAAFWNELARRFSAASSIPTLTWWNPGKDSPRLHLGFGPLTGDWFLPFALRGAAHSGPDQGGDLVDLTQSAAAAAQTVEAGRQRFGDVLEQGETKLTDLLQRLPRV
jgi:type VI secretion system ImpM family protein